jgi:hypothetical protein
VAAGTVVATDAQTRQAISWELQALALRARLDRLLVDAVATLTQAGIDHRVLKGAALEPVYPNPELRHHYDIDVLAPSDRFDDAVRALCGAGYRRRVPAPRPGYDARFAKSVTLVGPDHYELDLHRTLIDGPFGHLIDLPELWRRAAPVAVAGATLRGLAAEEQLLHACSSAALSDVPPRWSALRDVAELLRAGHVDPARFVEVAQRHRFGAVASTGITLTADGLGLDCGHPLIDWAATYELSRVERRRFRVYRDRRNFAHQSLETLLVVPGVRPRLAYAYAALWPCPEFLAAYGATRLGWLRRGQTSLRAPSPSTPAL